MVARVKSASLLGVEAIPVDVEVHSGNGLPGVSLVGLPTEAVREGHHRVRSAILSSGYAMPPRRVTVSLAPADLRKEGAAFDLPIAVGMLAAAGLASGDRFGGILLVGELGLDGTLRAVRGALPVARAAAERGFDGVVVPLANAAEAAWAGLPVYGARHLSEVVEFSKGAPLAAVAPMADMVPAVEDSDDLSDVRGQTFAKHAVEVAAAGGHNLLLVGPPGAGKTLLARRLRTILPPLSTDEAIEVAAIHSAIGVGLGRGSGTLLRQRPVRAPHHSISDVGLIGGGTPPRPGELSLAHRGVLFLDELPEFRRSALEALRQPLEEGVVRLARVRYSTTLPAQTTLVAAMNPCPCGHYGDPERTCICPLGRIQRYRGRLSGPLLDRLHLQVEVPAVTYTELRTASREHSRDVRARVVQARERQWNRLASWKLHTNADVPARLLDRFCPVPLTAHPLLEAAVTRLGISARAIAGIRRVARTLADLDERDEVSCDDFAQAIQFRAFDREVVA